MESRVTISCQIFVRQYYQLSYLLGSTTNWATKQHIGSEANFNMININKKE